MALSIGIRNSISLLPAVQATRPLTITLVGLSPTEHTSFILDTLPYGGFSPVRLQGWLIERCLPSPRRPIVAPIWFASLLRVPRFQSVHPRSVSRWLRA